MKSTPFDIISTDIDLNTIESAIRFKIKQRQELGVYEHFDLSKVTHYLLRDIRDKEEYLSLHLQSIARSWAVDVNDFEILKKQQGLVGLAEILLKKVIWKLLKFYTYRLFSQQREFNFQISNTILILEKKYKERLLKLEKELEELSGNR